MFLRFYDIIELFSKEKLTHILETDCIVLDCNDFHLIFRKDLINQSTYIIVYNEYTSCKRNRYLVLLHTHLESCLF